MADHHHTLGNQVRGFVEQATARLAACLPPSASPESIKGVVQERVSEQWQRIEPQRAKWSQQLRRGSARLAAAPIPQVARQGLEHLDALIDRLAPSTSNDDDSVAPAEQARHDVASETLVSPLDEASLDNAPNDDNCIAAGTTPGGDASPAKAPPRRIGKARRGRRGGGHGGSAKKQ